MKRLTNVKFVENQTSRLKFFFEDRNEKSEVIVQYNGVGISGIPQNAIIGQFVTIQAVDIYTNDCKFEIVFRKGLPFADFLKLNGALEGSILK